MGYIPENIIEEVLNRADIESVVGKYVSFTKRSGQNLMGLCPFHSEKTPSFNVNISRGIYKCFGCNKGGNSIKFIQEIEKLTYPEAIRYLAKEYNITVPEDTYDSNDSVDRKNKIDRVRKLLNDAGVFYYSKLKTSKEGLNYVKKRNISQDFVNKFGIGYAPDNWDELYKHLKRSGFTDDEMRDSGLFTTTKKGNLIDLLRGRLVFPIFDVFGKIIAFGGRNLGPELPKYVNSPDSLVYKKQEHLYGLHLAKKSQSSQIIIVEGYMDVISMHQAGVDNAVASLGTAFTSSQLKLVSKYASEVVFFFDSDNAGKSAALRALQMMLEYLDKMSGLKIRIKIANVPDGKDPDEYIKLNGKESFLQVVRNSLDVDDYLLKRAYEDNCDEKDVLDTYKYQEDIVLYSSWIRDDIKREKIAYEASKYLKATPQTVMSLINNSREEAIMKKEKEDIRATRREKQTQVSPEVHIPIDDICYQQEMELLILASRLKEQLATLPKSDILRPADFKGERMKSIVSYFLEHYKPESGTPEKLLIDKLCSENLNKTPAIDLYLTISDTLFMPSTVLEKIDMYKLYLYRLRIKKLKNEEKQLRTYLISLDDNIEKEKIKERLSKIVSIIDYYTNEEEKL